MTGFPVSPGELVDEAWLNAIGSRLLWDTTDAGISFPTASLTTPTIDSAFKHLMVVWQAQVSESTVQYLGLRINGDSSGHYYGNRLEVHGSTVAAADETAATSMKVGHLGDAGNTVYVGGGVIWLPGSQTGKAVPIRAASGAFHDATATNMWQGFFTYMKGDSGVAISTLTFLDQGGGNFVAGSRFSLYGVVG